MWKSLLFVPVLEDRFVKSVPSRGASAVVLDLEASIAQDRKTEARNALAHAVKQLSPDVDVTVRINPLWLDAIRDLEASVIAGVSALHLARCNSAGDVAAIDNVVGELEVERGLAKGSIRLVAMLESPGAVLSAEKIAAASPRMVGLTLGVEDYATEMGTKTSEDLLRRAGFDVIQAARAAHISPLVVPASMADFRDLDALETAARYARSLGSSGGYAVHPAQVKVLNEVFAPTAEELDWADRVLAASEDAATSGKAVFQVAGQMIDLPLINRAKRIAANR
ncbi:CoA ester lyase [Roseibium sp. MMSF_3544]|uniref:HpcH/HpaI aldolase/citrate lyase family protein n=1 Tax=unclassified Roseibium TaxID=2629323 RepID=UPI00273D8C81|nr:CoA ester lyase [Roseibium sp. MMSF_3544]